ncbi:MAG TPA: NADH-quinone oxidoreductase subunit J [Candidatus Paceibacterota bacterium]|nr:NADH-quinone oxidoreductase subunit J [Candidatus Paceibacterota bacterium]
MTIASAVAAMTLRNLIHCSLAVVVAFAGLAAAYLQLDAQFVGFAQILVYVGAISILVVFAILLTRSGENPNESVFSKSWTSGLAVVIAVLAILVWAITHSSVIKRELPAAPDVTVQKLGETLMNKFVLPLEVIGLLLTAALIGAVIIAMHDKEEKK